MPRLAMRSPAPAAAALAFSTTWRALFTTCSVMPINSRYLGSCCWLRSAAVMRWIVCMRRRALRVRLVKPCTPSGSFSWRSPMRRGNGAHRVPQQGGIGGVMNVGFHHRGVDAESLGVLQPQLDSGLDHELIDITKRLRRKWVEGAVERILLGEGLAVKRGKAAQREDSVDALWQFAIIPVLEAHEN